MEGEEKGGGYVPSSQCPHSPCVKSKLGTSTCPFLSCPLSPYTLLSHPQERDCVCECECVHARVSRGGVYMYLGVVQPSPIKEPLAEFQDSHDISMVTDLSTNSPRFLISLVVLSGESGPREG